MSIIPSGSDLLKQLMTAYGRSEDAGYMTAAVMTILLYDMCTTIVDEIEFIWKQRWTLAKMLYLFARYYPPIFTAVTLRVLLFFAILCLAEFGVEFYISWVVSQETARTTFRGPLPGWRGCLTLPVSVRIHSLAAWTLCAAVGFVFFAFSMWKFKDSLTDDTGSVRLDFLKDQRYISPVLTVFMRDGAMFFLIILITLIVNAVLTSWGNGGLGMFGLPWVPAIYSLVGSHMVLDLRKAGDEGHPTRISNHVFAPNPLVFAPSRSDNIGSFGEETWRSRVSAVSNRHPRASMSKCHYLGL
ncbi:hypothetical protein NLJ89_g3800 [Agrocybe chaxingu]|uniref:DUF6533 domain-containing protein n=1 Tax=Agrocybe chaxingu TaxID=84603 RepID=A0A9W8K1T4_9AGAR|nr:hypothetical protein NLJ89_g3800 [Agrocybe chaxingu]